MLMAGTKESATLNAILVVFKLIALAIFVAVALPAFDSANLQPFMPYGFAKSIGPDGVEHGVMAAAAIIFFAFYGFDAIDHINNKNDFLFHGNFKSQNLTQQMIHTCRNML